MGAVDPRSTDDRADDVVADFTNGGNDERRPDVVAPGRSVVSRITNTGLPSAGASSCTPPESLSAMWQRSSARTKCG